MAASRRGEVARKIYWRSFSLFETSVYIVNAIAMLFEAPNERNCVYSKAITSSFYGRLANLHENPERSGKLSEHAKLREVCKTDNYFAMQSF